jgi:hypothetical protein
MEQGRTGGLPLLLSATQEIFSLITKRSRGGRERNCPSLLVPQMEQENEVFVIILLVTHSGDKI